MLTRTFKYCTINTLQAEIIFLCCGFFQLSIIGDFTLLSWEAPNMYFLVPYIGKWNILEVYSVSTVYHLLLLEVMEVMEVMEAMKVKGMETTGARIASMEQIPWGLWQRCWGCSHTWWEGQRIDLHWWFYTVIGLTRFLTDWMYAATFLLHLLIIRQTCL